MLRTEADVVRTLEGGSYTLEQLYAMCEAEADIERDGGMNPTSPQHQSDRVWKRRVRNALQHRKARGQAANLDRGSWLLHGTPEHPRRLILIHAGVLCALDLRVATAVDLFGSLDEPIDLVVADPPYALGRGTDRSSANRIYATRDADSVVPGYVDVPAEDYEAFTREWISAAYPALRMGGQVAIITGPQQAAVVQYTAERAGLSFVSSIAAYKAFAKKTTRRPAFAHWTITVVSRGPQSSSKRTFNVPPDLPKARSGADYPLDFWTDNGRLDRKGDALKYDNSLPQTLIRRIVLMLSNEGDLLVDPFLGGGSTAEAAMDMRRRFIGGDINERAIAFTGARLLNERIWPEASAA